VEMVVRGSWGYGCVIVVVTSGCATILEVRKSSISRCCIDPIGYDDCHESEASDVRSDYDCTLDCEQIDYLEAVSQVHILKKCNFRRKEDGTGGISVSHVHNRNSVQLKLGSNARSTSLLSCLRFYTI
jgi:hypothetical protein